MKLWQKIFLISLALIIAVVNIVSVTLLNNSHRLLLERERSHAIMEHDYFAASFINAVVYEKMARSELVLDDREVEHIARKVISEGGQSFHSAIYRSSGYITGSDLPSVLTEALSEEYLDKIDKSGERYGVEVFNVDNRKMMTIGSSVTAENTDYIVVTAVDITEIYALREQQSEFVRRVSIGASAVISLILLITTLLLLRPLNRLNIYTKAIAGGKYNLRIHRKGSQEFRELADNMNIMADAVQTHAAHLEKIAESRQTFIANLAHEMKTPLTSILGFADLLRIKKVVPDNERMEYAAVIVEETRRLRSLSGKLMELVAMGGTEIEKKPVSLPKLIRETETAMTPMLIKNQVNLICNYEEIIFNADEELFKSLLYNIIENAVKASPMGSEIILNSAMYEGDAVITITDHGIGMTPDEVQKVFEPFFMADKSRSRKAGGAGLGLALCAEIAKLHNTILEIDSRKGEGTTVFITISGEECL